MYFSTASIDALESKWRMEVLSCENCASSEGGENQKTETERGAAKQESTQQVITDEDLCCDHGKKTSRLGIGEEIVFINNSDYAA